MASFFRKRLAPDRETLLRAVPVPNQLVRATAESRALRLTAPLRSSALGRVFAGKSAAAATPRKIFELDELGAWVWGQLDGRRNVETLIHGFARHFRVNIREAEVAVLAFLKTLIGRNLIALVAPRKS